LSHCTSCERTGLRCCGVCFRRTCGGEFLAGVSLTLVRSRGRCSRGSSWRPLALGASPLSQLSWPHAGGATGASAHCPSLACHAQHASYSGEDDWTQMPRPSPVPRVGSCPSSPERPCRDVRLPVGGTTRHGKEAPLLTCAYRSAIGLDPLPLIPSGSGSPPPAPTRPSSCGGLTDSASSGLFWATRGGSGTASSAWTPPTW